MKALDEVLLPCDVTITLAATNYGPLIPYERRHGIMWHYDASRTDAGAESWFDSPAFKLSYNRAYTDSGRRIKLTPSIRRRAFHAGHCRKDARVTDANAAFYGLCITAGLGQQATPAQFAAICRDTADIARYHHARGDAGWSNIEYWLTGHADWAAPPGRKQDPTGPDPMRPVLSLKLGRIEVARLLAGEDAAAPFVLLKRGVRHAQVLRLQQLLGITPATGFYGELTERAVAAFQSANGLEPDGVAGRATQALLFP